MCSSSKDSRILLQKKVNSGLWNLNKQYNQIVNEIHIHKIIKPSYIENILKVFATGNWEYES